MKQGAAALALLPVVLAAGACESATLPGSSPGDVYEFRLDVVPPRVLRWPSGATVRVHVEGGSASLAPQLQAAFEQGAAAWNRQALLGEYRLAGTTDLDAADVVLRWAGDPSPVDLSGCTPASGRAITTFCLAGAGTQDSLITFPRADGGSSRVKMVITVLASETSIPGRVAALVVHELGHVLGIVRHSDSPNDLMHERQLTAREPSARDAATVRLLYQMQPSIVP